MKKIFILASLLIASINFSLANSICTQTINLNAGWNLISFDVSPADKSISNVFGALQTNNVQFITGFNNGAKIFNPYQPLALNSLVEIEDGYGYWIKVENADVLTVEGTCIADDYRIPLKAGWNLIAYPPDAPQNPRDYFANLIANGDFEIVVGFNNHVLTYTGIGFVESLQLMENGFGYWVYVHNESE